MVGCGKLAAPLSGAPVARGIQAIHSEKWVETTPGAGVGVSKARERIRGAGKVWKLADLQPDGRGTGIGVVSR